MCWLAGWLTWEHTYTSKWVVGINMKKVRKNSAQEWNVACWPGRGRGRASERASNPLLVRLLCTYTVQDRLKRKEEGAKKQIKNFFFFLGADDGFATQSKWNSHLDWNIIIIFNFHRSSDRTHKRSCEKLQIVEGWTGGRLDSSNRPVPSLDSITK